MQIFGFLAFCQFFVSSFILTQNVYNLYLCNLIWEWNAVQRFISFSWCFKHLFDLINTKKTQICPCFFFELFSFNFGLLFYIPVSALHGWFNEWMTITNSFFSLCSVLCKEKPQIISWFLNLRKSLSIIIMIIKFLFNVHISDSKFAIFSFAYCVYASD